VIVAIAARLRRSETYLADVAETWPRTARILDADGRHLTDIDALGPPRGDQIELVGIDDPAALIDQYFGRGAPSVMLILGDSPIIGRLRTCWEGGRRSWWLTMDAWPRAH
jgi:hypothetical protein